MSEVKVNKISPRTNCGTITVGDAGDAVSVTAGVPVTVNGDLKSNALKAVDGGNIVNQCGTTITLGASGDTIQLACGASQTGFGRTGTVDWDTTAKTTNFTAVSGNGYFVDTTSGAVTMTLPATPSAGDIVSVKDYAYTFETNNLTVGRNGSPIGGDSGVNPTYDVNGTSKTFIYVDGTKGWLVVNESTDTSTAESAAYISATGGSITTVCTDYKVHTFTSPGTFCISAGEGNLAFLDYTVVAGGGGGSCETGPGAVSGGGGAGGFRESKNACYSGCWAASPLASSTSLGPFTGPVAIPVTVGGGGAVGSSGSNSVFSTITSAGGGDGTSSGQTPDNGTPGGSGGGGSTCAGTGGTGNTPPVSPPQGQPGGNGNPDRRGSGGGGGATASGSNASPPNDGGPGGAGATNSITSSPVARAGGGGGGGTDTAGGSGPGGTGGTGGGGNGGASNTNNATAGTANTGGGGGGGGENQPSKAGGSGIVIIRYKFQ